MADPREEKRRMIYQASFDAARQDEAARTGQFFQSVNRARTFSEILDELSGNVPLGRAHALTMEGVRDRVDEESQRNAIPSGPPSFRDRWNALYDNVEEG